MALPYPTKVVLPFDIATAQDMNERHANDVALANGSGLDDGAVISEKIDPAALSPRAGVIPGSTFATTGSKSVTGVGFKPSLVEFELLSTQTTQRNRVSTGVMTTSAVYANATISEGSSSASRSWSGGSNAIAFAWINASASPLMAFAYVSFDSDGFTVNVSVADGTFDVAYKAYR